MGRLKLLKQVAAGLARQFGPDCEIVIHDLKTKDLEHSSIWKTVMSPADNLGTARRMWC